MFSRVFARLRCQFTVIAKGSGYRTLGSSYHLCYSSYHLDSSYPPRDSSDPATFDQLRDLIIWVYACARGLRSRYLNLSGGAEK